MKINSKTTSTTRLDNRLFPAKFEKNGKTYNRLQINANKAWYIIWDSDIIGFTVITKNTNGKLSKESFMLDTYGYSKSFDLAQEALFS